MPRILIVDDSAVIRALVSRWLRGELDLVLDLHESGEKALVAALLAPPDALITDLNMPGMGGVGLARALRALPGLAGLPIAIFGGDDEETRLALEASGAIAAIAKPFEAAGLIALIRRLLKPCP